MAAKKKPVNPFLGVWRIIWMSAWEEDYLNEEGQAYFEFEARDSGEFHFGYVQGFMDCRLTMRDGKLAVEWTWDGNDEMESAQGRGWAVIDGKELKGMLFFHQGDESEFRAQKVQRRKSRKGK